jgi:hypothetical protein
MGDHVGSGAADCEHDGLGGGIGAAASRPFAPLRGAAAGQPCLAQRYPERDKSWGHSSAGRAPALQAGGRRFDPGWLHWRKCLEIGWLRVAGGTSLVPVRAEVPQAGQEGRGSNGGAIHGSWSRSRTCESAYRRSKNTARTTPPPVADGASMPSSPRWWADSPICCHLAASLERNSGSPSCSAARVAESRRSRRAPRAMS